MTQKYSAGSSVLPFFLGGKLVTSAKTMPVIDKFTNEVAHEVSLASSEDVENAIAEGYKATEAMKKLTSYQKKDILMSLASDISQRAEELSYTLCVEAGKPIKDAKVEVARAIDTFTIAAEEAVRLNGSYLPLDISQRNAGLSAITRRFPVGLVSMIAPFNFPLNLVAHKVAPAIAAGCPFLLKPSDRTPLSALIVGESLAKTNLPAGAFSILPCETDAAKHLVTDERIRAFSFTGSERVGWQLHRDAGRKKVVLELGGNAPCIIDETNKDRLDHVVKRLIFGAFYYSGQSCISVQRIFVHESIYDALKEKFVAEAATLKKGDPMEEDTFIGPVISENDAKRIESWVNEAVSKGGNVLVGGKRDGCFYDATIVENVPRDVTLSCEEVFGPVCTLEKYTDFKEVIKHINSSRFGLQSGVFTHNFDKAFYAYEHLDMGGVVINDVPSIRVESQPYGGVKASGLGREGLLYAIEDFSELKIMLLRDAGAKF